MALLDEYDIENTTSLVETDEDEKPTWELDEDIFWDIHPCLTYDSLFNFIIGNRGGGKTYGAKKFCIERYIKTGEQFVYVRRYKTELKRINTFFDDIAEAFEGNEFKVSKKGEFIINGQIAGYSIPLSTAKIEKSVSYPKVKTIIFDEFIIDKGNYKYIPDEVTAFLELYETIARMRDVRVLFLSNAISITNPYFLYFDLQLPTYGKKNIWYKDEKLVELVAKESFIELKKKSRFGKVIAGTAYGDYAIENKFLRDSDTFVEKKSGQCTFLFTLVYNGMSLGIWMSYGQGKLWVSNDYEKNNVHKYALTKEDHTPNTVLLKSLRNSRSFRMLEDAFQNGYLYFESINIKNVVFQIFKLYSRY